MRLFCATLAFVIKHVKQLVFYQEDILRKLTFSIVGTSYRVSNDDNFVATIIYTFAVARRYIFLKVPGFVRLNGSSIVLTILMSNV